MVVVDEWQDFVGALDFADVLATSRGMAVGWTLSHQLMPQLSSSLSAAVLANARSRLVFRPAEGDAKPLAAVLGAGADAERLLRLGAFQAAARVLVEHTPSAAFGIHALPLGPPTANAAALRAHSAAWYGQPAAELDARQLQRWQGDQHREQDGGAVGVKKRRPRP
jgi:hypothetical protein